VFLQLEQYKLVSQSFEKRVLDLQKEIKSKDEEIASLKAETGFHSSANHGRIDGMCHLISYLCSFSCLLSIYYFTAGKSGI